MLPDNLVGSVRNKFEKPLEIKPEKPVVSTERTLTAPVTTSNLSEKNFTADLQRNLLFRKFEPATFKPTENPAEPIDYFEVDKQADELIKKYTEDGFLWTEPLNTDGLGKELADIAKTDPDRAAALTDNILDKIDGGDKDEVAQSFTESLSPSELRDFAKTDRGKELLGKLRQHLEDGVTWDDEDATIARIDTAIKAADFEKSAEFKALSPETQKEVLSRLDSNQGNNAATDNLIDLTKNADFAKLSPATQKKTLEAFDARKEDKVFVENLKTLVGKPEFQSLSEAQQATALADVQKFTATESYADASDDDKKYLLNLVGDMSIYNSQNPSLTSVRNSLDKVLSGEIPIKTFDEPSSKGFITLGRADDGVMYMNKNADAQIGISNAIDTFVHEINHVVNGETDAGTADRFMDEYGARIIGRLAGGGTFDAETQQEALNTLIFKNAPGYQHLRDLYNSNPKFRAVIDGLQADLKKDPPVISTPEQVRQKLVDAGFDSDYLLTPRNLDNH